MCGALDGRPGMYFFKEPQGWTHVVRRTGWSLLCVEVYYERDRMMTLLSNVDVSREWKRYLRSFEHVAVRKMAVELAEEHLLAQQDSHTTAGWVGVDFDCRDI